MANGHSDDDGFITSSDFSSRGVSIAGGSLLLRLDDSSLVVVWLVVVRKNESAFRLRLFCCIGGDMPSLVSSVALVGSDTYIRDGCCRHLFATGR